MHDKLDLAFAQYVANELNFKLGPEKSSAPIEFLVHVACSLRGSHVEPAS